MKLTINKGDSFVCIKDVLMNGNPDDIAYQAGLIYTSEREGCITNDGDNSDHSWQYSIQLPNYFIKL